VTKAEISFDIVMDDDMDFVEGSYRLPGHDWEVLIISKEQIEQPLISTSGKWRSGVTGTHIQFPEVQKLNKMVALQLLSGALGVTDWQEVHGPDSMRLRDYPYPSNEGGGDQ